MHPFTGRWCLWVKVGFLNALKDFWFSRFLLNRQNKSWNLDFWGSRGGSNRLRREKKRWFFWCEIPKKSSDLNDTRKGWVEMFASENGELQKMKKCVTKKESQFTKLPKRFGFSHVSPVSSAIHFPTCTTCKDQVTVWCHGRSSKLSESFFGLPYDLGRWVKTPLKIPGSPWEELVPITTETVREKTHGNFTAVPFRKIQGVRQQNTFRKRQPLQKTQKKHIFLAKSMSSWIFCSNTSLEAPYQQQHKPWFFSIQWLKWIKASALANERLAIRLVPNRNHS